MLQSDHIILLRKKLQIIKIMTIAIYSDKLLNYKSLI